MYKYRTLLKGFGQVCLVNLVPAVAYLPLLSELACSIHPTWLKPFSRPSCKHILDSKLLQRHARLGINQGAVNTDTHNTDALVVLVTRASVLCVSVLLGHFL